MDYGKEGGGLDQSAKTQRRLLDVDDVARLLKCSGRHVRRLADRGAMPLPVRLGALIRWDEVAITSWISNGCPNLFRRKGARS